MSRFMLITFTDVSNMKKLVSFTFPAYTLYVIYMYAIIDHPDSTEFTE